MKTRIALYALIYLCISSGCGGTASEGEVRQEFSIEMELLNDCEETAQCTVIFAGCPLGCGVGVNAEHADELAETARRLIREWEGFSQSCEYECVPAVAECVELKCEAVTLNR